MQHTQFGVVRNYAQNATLLKGQGRTDAVSPAVKRVIEEHRQSIKKDPQTDVYRNKTEGSLLVITQASDARGPEHFALFSKAGVLVKRFEIDV